MKNEFIEHNHGLELRLQKFRGMCMNSDLRREAGILESLFPERFSSKTLVRPEKDSGTDPDKPRSTCPVITVG